MALLIECDRCGDELNKPGAVLIAPPRRANGVPGDGLVVKKFHYCAKCYDWLREELK